METRLIIENANLKMASQAMRSVSYFYFLLCELFVCLFLEEKLRRNQPAQLFNVLSSWGTERKMKFERTGMRYCFLGHL